MKTLIWTIAGVLAALWTGASALLALLADGVGSMLKQAGAAAAPAAPPTPDLPAWLAGWVDPAAWAALAQSFHSALGMAQAALPAVGTAAGALGMLVWLLWGFGMAALLALATGSHWLAGRALGGPRLA